MRQGPLKHNLLLAGFTLFSMFLGAGNLTFPPFLGTQVDSLTWQAIGGFLISAVGLPVMGVAAVALSGGLANLVGRVYPWLAFLFTLPIYLSIGPCLTIPKTASTSFKMTVLPALIGINPNMQGVVDQTGFTLRTLSQFACSALFFIVAMIVAFKPEKPTDRLGRVLCPALLVLIGVIFTRCLVWSMGSYGTSSQLFSSGPAIRGLPEGYQTMNTIAALSFGTVIALSIRVGGVEQEGAIVWGTIKVGVIAGILLALIYGVPAHVGASADTAMANTENGARIPTYAAGSLFGQAGMMILGTIFPITCFSACVGLLSYYSQYFTTIVPLIGYKMWVAVFTVVSLVTSSAGLNRILAVSAPVLSAIYPVVTVLVMLAFMDPLIKRWPAMFSCSILFTGIVSVVYALEQGKVVVLFLSRVATSLPDYEVELGWVVPALVGVAADAAVSSAVESDW